MADHLTVLPITTWGTACGIAEYANHLIDANTRLSYADQGGVFYKTPDPEHLDPEALFAGRYHGHPRNITLADYDVVWLNYHAALHARWTPAQVERLIKQKPVVITYHDTGVPNSDQCKAMYASVPYALKSMEQLHRPFIVHEPADDLPGAIFIRQGVPAAHYPATRNLQEPGHPWAPVDGIVEEGEPWTEILGIPWGRRPVVGTVGFPFPWKNYDLLCQASALAGWATLLFAPRATDAQIQTWRRLNPWTAVVRAFVPSEAVVRGLSGCDATAFLYTCANTGTSGAIRQGIAARKPVLASRPNVCRQFRDLTWVGVYSGEVQPDPAITWLDDLRPEAVARMLELVPIAPIHPSVHRLAERDSWRNVAKRYAEIFRSVAEQDNIPLENRNSRG